VSLTFINPASSVVLGYAERRNLISVRFFFKHNDSSLHQKQPIVPAVHAARCCIPELRHIAELLAPSRDYTCLTEIEKDLALVMEPKSKLNRLVYPHVTAQAGSTLMVEADAANHLTALARARQFRNGLMVALLAFHPIRLKNFAAFEIGRTFVKVKNKWWIVLPASETKEGRLDEIPGIEMGHGINVAKDNSQIYIAQESTAHAQRQSSNHTKPLRVDLGRCC
jgi:hypothetical protein